MFVVSWTTSCNLRVVCFGVPSHLQDVIRSGLRRSGAEKRKLILEDPQVAMNVILHQLVPAYDRSVWAIRDHVCDWGAGSSAPRFCFDMLGQAEG